MRSTGVSSYNYSNTFNEGSVGVGINSINSCSTNNNNFNYNRLYRFVLVGVILIVLFVSFFYGRSTFDRKIAQEGLGLHLDHDPTTTDDDLTEYSDDDPHTRKKREWVETISWEPRAFLYHNFITSQECDHVIAIGEPNLMRSQVVGVTGASVVDPGRSSHGTFLSGSNDPVLIKIKKKIAEWTHLPEENGESFYLLRYEEGQEYRPHTDYFTEDANGKAFIGRSGNRIATVLLYLSTPEEGGETIFPRASIKVPAVKGSALLFWDSFPDGTVDPLSLHGSNPVIKGTKWAMTRWIRPNQY